MKKYVLPVIFFLLTSCNSDENNSVSCEGVNCQIEDSSGDAAFSFIDIEKLNIVFTDSEIVVEMTVLDIPSTLTYNSTNLTDNYLEYSWEINFDTDGDGTDANDISMEMLHFKPPASVESQDDILEFTQKNVWLNNTEGNGASVVGNVSVTRDSSKLIFNVQRIEHDQLQSIDISTPVKFKASYNSAGTQYEDIYPDNGGYTN